MNKPNFLKKVTQKIKPAAPEHRRRLTDPLPEKTANFSDGGAKAGAANGGSAAENRQKLAQKFSIFKKKDKKEKIEDRRLELFEKDASLRPRQLFVKFNLQDQIIFAKRLSVLVKAGIPILSSLRMLEEQAGSRHGARIIKDLRDQMEKGKSLASGMNCYQKLFGEFAVNIVRVGEMSGTLVQNLNYLADELKKKQELRRNIIGALIYPAFIVVATIAIVIMLTVFLFPKILPLFNSFNAELPWSTKALIIISDTMGTYWAWMLGGLFAFIIIYNLLLRLPAFKLFSDTLLLRWPILGRMFKSYHIANSTRTMSLLLKSEVGILESLRVAGETSGNAAYQKAFREISEGVIKGEPMSDTMKKQKLLFPILVPQMVQVGEMTGSLNSSLMYVSEMFEDEMTTSTKNLTTSIEPILMVMMGVMVGFVALSIITPIYGITQSLQP